MAKRKLSKHQTRRIKRNQNASLENANRESSHSPQASKGQKKPPTDASLTDLLAEDAALGPEQKGRVVAHYGTQVEIETDSSTALNCEALPSQPSFHNPVVRCHLRANLDPVITGDHIIWRPYGDGGVVVSCETRKTLLCRPDPYGKLKPVAANVDQIIIVIAPEPEFFTNLIDRYLVVAEINHITPILVVNKVDLIGDSNRDHFENIKGLYRGLGYMVHEMSAKANTGLVNLQSLLDHKTSIFVGQSGVGKSSIIQSLLPHHDIEIGDLSQARAKGRHTTTHSQLFRFEHGGECIDSPGIREFGLWNLNNDDIIRGFPEIDQLSQQCKFRDCKHESEPKCAVQAGLEERRIASSRFENYRRILAGLDDVEIRSPPPL